jgi:hypothetical protein
MKGKIPYRGVENIRGENADVEGVDGDGEEDELQDEE